MDLGKPLISGLIFPVLPIAVIALTQYLCGEIWMASFYTPGEDGGEFEPAMALIGIPILLMIISLMLAALTAVNRWRIRRSTLGAGPRWLLGVPRVLQTLVAVLLFFVSAGFFMGELSGVFRHWQVAVAWVMFAATAGVFLRQQYLRLRE